MHCNLQAEFMKCCQNYAGSTAPFCCSASHHNGGEVGTRCVKASQPVAVTSNVCSNCALLLPSLVTHVHSSGQCVSFQAPALIMGSIENVIPSFMMPLACNDSLVRLLHVTQPHYSTQKTCQGMTPEQPMAGKHKLYCQLGSRQTHCGTQRQPRAPHS